MKQAIHVSAQAFGWAGLITTIDLAMRGEHSFFASRLIQLLT